MSDSWESMDCSPLGSSVHRIFQAKILECVAISFSRGSSWPRDQTHVSCTVGRFFTDWDTKVNNAKTTSATSQTLGGWSRQLPNNAIACRPSATCPSELSPTGHAKPSAACFEPQPVTSCPAHPGDTHISTKFSVRQSIAITFSKMWLPMPCQKIGCVFEEMPGWSLYCRGPQPPGHRSVPVWPVRNWATWQEVSGRQVCKISSLFTAVPHHLRPLGPWKIVFHETCPWCHKGWGPLV